MKQWMEEHVLPIVVGNITGPWPSFWLTVIAVIVYGFVIFHPLWRLTS